MTSNLKLGKKAAIWKKLLSSKSCTFPWTDQETLKKVTLAMLCICPNRKVWISNENVTWRFQIPTSFSKGRFRMVGSNLIQGLLSLDGRNC